VNASTGNKGVAMTFDGTASLDPNGKTITAYAWNFGRPELGVEHGHHGAGEPHVPARRHLHGVAHGDRRREPDRTKTSTVVIANIAPAIAAFSGATLLPGETYSAAGSFADADPNDTWTATVDYGAGEGAACPQRQDVLAQPPVPDPG
jgi:hypothetical protein